MQRLATLVARPRRSFPSDPQVPGQRARRAKERGNHRRGRPATENSHPLFPRQDPGPQPQEPRSGVLRVLQGGARQPHRV